MCADAHVRKSEFVENSGIQDQFILKRKYYQQDVN